MGKKRKKCHEVICQYLIDYIGSQVTLTLRSGLVVSGELVDILKNGLIVLKETDTLSPFTDELITIVRSRDVEIATIQT